MKKYSIVFGKNEAKALDKLNGYYLTFGDFEHCEKIADIVEKLSAELNGVIAKVDGKTYGVAKAYINRAKALA